VSRLAIAEQMIAHYNAQDADAYVALMTDDACEAGYRGAVVREGKEGTRAGLKAMFAEFPENRAEILEGYEFGEFLFRAARTRVPFFDRRRAVRSDVDLFL
jgi:hypothetical protein